MKCPPSLLLHPLIFWAACAHAEPLVPAGNEQVRRIMESYAGRGTLADGTPPTEAREAAQAFLARPATIPRARASETDQKAPSYHLLKVWHTDPLICPHCQHRMRVLALIDQKKGIEKILLHLNLWRGLPAFMSPRGPPPAIPKHWEADAPRSRDPFPDYDDVFTD